MVVEHDGIGVYNSISICINEVQSAAGPIDSAASANSIVVGVCDILGDSTVFQDISRTYVENAAAVLNSGVTRYAAA